MAERRGTRIPCEIPATLSSRVPVPFYEPCQIVLVNPHGCAARIGRAVEIGAAVQLVGLAVKYTVPAQVVNCISLGTFGKLWLLGLALEHPGNVWGVETPPEDWNQ